MPKTPTFISPFFTVKKIAITGASGCGKTTFLVSLLNHLQAHDPALFDMDVKNKKKKKFIDFQLSTDRNHSYSPGTKKWQFTPFQEYRKQLARGSFPDKTVSESWLAVRLAMKHWRRFAHLYLYDIPGERFADAAILDREYSVWSDDIVGGMIHRDFKAGDQHKLTFIRDYATLMNSQDESTLNSLNHEEIVLAYKKAMGEMLWRNYQGVCPSIFTLDEYGSDVMKEIERLCKNVPLDEAITELASERQSGIKDKEFAPLSKKIRDNRPDLTKTMVENYKVYVEKQRRVFEVIIGCDGLIVLVDIAHILQGGKERLRDAYEFHDNVFNAVDPKKNILTPLWGALGITRVISKIAVVASQTDRFHKDDESILQNLADMLFDHPLNQIGGIEYKSFACASVRTTEIVDENNLKGVLSPSANSTLFPVSRLPTGWENSPRFPDNWNPRDFKDIPRPHPPIPTLPSIPPPQTGMNEVLKFITDW